MTPMHAIVTTAGGLSWQQVPDVDAGPGEVLIEVRAAGVNRADLLQADGKYPPPPGASEIIGLEVSGVIAELGDGVTNLTVGQPVCEDRSGRSGADNDVVEAVRHS